MNDYKTHKKIYKIEGLSFENFEEFVDECNRSFILELQGKWNGNLDAFNDYLTWSDESYILHWKDSDKSRETLGYAAMALWLSKNLETCHPSNRASVRKRLRAALNSEGQTLFEMIVEIIEENSPFVTLDFKTN